MAVYMIKAMSIKIMTHLEENYHSNSKPLTRERSGSVVENLTRDRGEAGSSLTGVTALRP